MLRSLVGSEMCIRDSFSTPEDDASLLSPPDAPTRPSTLAPRSQLSPASPPFIPSSTRFYDHGVVPHYERQAHTSTFSVATPPLDTADGQPSSAQFRLPSDITSSLPPPPEPPPIIDEDPTLLQSSVEQEDLPEHVQILFLQTVEDVNLSTDTTRDLKALLHAVSYTHLTLPTKRIV